MIKIGYSADAFIFDFEAGTVRLRPDYDHFQNRVNMDFTDDDATLDGDNSNEEIDADPTQTAVISGDTLGYSSYSDVACFGPVDPVGHTHQPEVHPGQRNFAPRLKRGRRGIWSSGGYRDTVW